MFLANVALCPNITFAYIKTHTLFGDDDTKLVFGPVWGCCAPTLRFHPALCFSCVLTSIIKPVLSPSLRLYFCTSPWLLYKPAVWSNVYFVALLNTFCVFSFLNSRSCFPLCLSFSVFCLVGVYPFIFFNPLFFFLHSPVIWFIMFTAVNFHLVLFFLYLTLPPLHCPLCLVWLWFWGWLCHPGSFLHCSWSLPPHVTLPFDLCGPLLCTLPLSMCGVHSWSPAHVALVLWWWFLLSPGILLHHTSSTLPNHHPHDDPCPLTAPTPPLLHLGPNPPRPLPWTLLTAQPAGSKSGKGSSSGSQ